MTSHPAATAAQGASPKVACSSCKLRALCLPVGFSGQALERLNTRFSLLRSVNRSATLFRVGDPFEALFAVRSGFFKTRVSCPNRADQVTGFQMPGELLGLDGISIDRHCCDAVALEDSQVCVIPYDQLEHLSRESSELQHQFHKIMGGEIVREQSVMLLLGNMRAEERLAAFLLNLAARLRARELSPSKLVLRMTREEIGSYLGLKLETVSRCFSKLHEDGVLQVRQRHIRIVDEDALDKLVNRARWARPTGLNSASAAAPPVCNFAGAFPDSSG